MRYRTLGMMVMAVALALASCKKEAHNNRAPSTPPPVTYSFDKYGPVGDIPYRDYRQQIQIRLADLDGDGDLDIVAGLDGKIVVYENNLEQKGRQAEATSQYGQPR